jgi:serine/threonine protein phosphatase PrpC
MSPKDPLKIPQVSTLDNPWKGIARTAIGSAHKKQGLPCQDAADWRTVGEVAIAALADGAGSAAYAAQGATVAVKTALAILERRVTICPRETLFEGLVEEVIVAFKHEASALNCSLQDLACTLNLAVLAPEWVAVAQIGDGFIVLARDATYEIPFAPDKGEYANETVFVTTPNASLMIVAIELTIDFVCLSSDGLYDVAVRHSNNTPHPPFFTPLVQFMKITEEPEREDNYLMTFLHSDRLAQRSDDDKSLVLIKRR